MGFSNFRRTIRKTCHTEGDVETLRRLHVTNTKSDYAPPPHLSNPWEMVRLLWVSFRPL